MAKSIDNISAKRLIAAHQTLLSELSAAENRHAAQAKEVANAAVALAAQEAMQMLKNIPVEELNRDKRGIRVKALRDYGFTNVAAVCNASIPSLACVHGISDESAHTIKAIANDIADTTRQNVKIKLSADDKSVSATRLVVALSKYRNSIDHTEVCRTYLKRYRTDVGYGMEDLSVATQSLRWMFASKAKKERAILAYQTLSALQQGADFRSAKAAAEALDAIDRLSPTAAWTDFSHNSIRFFNVLEDLVPGILGNGDDVYGLPEELARQIQDEVLFPDGLLCELRRYQEWGVKYALHQERVLLGDEMGLGKTVQAIAAMVSLKNTGASHFIVVCPASVLANWCREIRNKSRLSVIKVHGPDRAAALQTWLQSGGVAVTTYETTSSFKLDKDFKYDMLVVDEAHYIKNPQAQRTTHVKKLCDRTDRILFMTGTALENKVEEMVALIKILQPEVAAAVHGMEFMSSAPQFREKVAPVYYRRKREDVLTELPDLIENKEWCDMTPVEEQVYEDIVLSKNPMAARRVSWNVTDLQHSSKATRMMEIIEEAKEEGRKTIVFSFFLDTIDKITALLGESCYGPINGSVLPQRRQEIIDEFDAAPAGSVLTAQIQAGGTGLNIQSASVVILCEPQFKPSTENQAISRAYRMGQSRNVLVHRLLCENTIDERITDILEAKQEIFDAFADRSVAAKESQEIDEKTYSNLIQEEIDRINAKRAAELPTPNA